MKYEVDFLPGDKHESFLWLPKVILSLLMSMIKHSQSTQSTKFAIYQKKLAMEFTF